MRRDAREVWSKRVEQWRRSGQTAKEFAARSGINANTLMHWSWRLGSKGGGNHQGRGAGGAAASSGECGAVQFVELLGVTPPTADVDPRLEVLLPGGAKLCVPRGFDAATLRHVVHVLEGR